MITQVALGLKPKERERVTVFVKTQDSPELAIGSLTMGTADQFTLGSGLTFSAGETVTVRHNGSTSVCLTGRIEDDFDDDMDLFNEDEDDEASLSDDDSDDDEDSESDGEDPKDVKVKTQKLAAAAAAAELEDASEPSEDDDSSDDEEDSDD